MSDEFDAVEASRKIRNLVPSKNTFVVGTEYERQRVQQLARALSASGVIDFQIFTRKTKGGFVVAAFPNNHKAT